MSLQRNTPEYDEDRMWYLLLLFGVPVATREQGMKEHFRTVQEECKTHGITIRKLLVHWGKSRDTNGRYVFRFSGCRRDDAAAVRFAESFLYAFSLVHGPIAERDHDSLILRIPPDIIKGRTAVLLDDLIRLEESREPDPLSVKRPRLTIGQTTITSRDRFEAAWRVCNVTYSNENLFEATRFLKTSFDNFYVWPGQISQVASDPEMGPITSSHQAKSEDALLNAFKAVEAIIGDPPKDEAKLFHKLRLIGVDPEEAVGYRGRRALHQVIRQMSRDRDKKAAHGSTRDRTIKAADLLDYQECAAWVVLSAIEKSRKESRKCSIFSSR